MRQSLTISPLSGAGGFGYDTSSALRLNGTTASGSITLLSDANITGRGGSVTGLISGNYSLTFGRPAGGNGAQLGNFNWSNATGARDTYTGDTILTEGTLVLNSTNLIPTGAGFGDVVLTQPFSNNPTVLDLHSTNQTINGLVDTLGTNVGTVTNSALSGGPNVLTVGNNNATSTFNGALTDSGQYHGLSLTKIGSGTLTLGGTNSYIGATTVSGGTLQLASTSTLTNTSGINTTGGTLLFGASNQVTNAPAVALANGGLSMQGLSGATETLGALTLTATSTIDFGKGNALGNTLMFASLNLAAGTIFNVVDWTGSIYYGMTDSGSDTTQDRLLFTSLSAAAASELGQIYFYSDSGTFLGTGQQVLYGTPGMPTPEVVPVPEPSTLGVGLGLIGLLFWKWLRARLLFRETRA